MKTAPQKCGILAAHKSKRRDIREKKVSAVAETSQGREFNYFIVFK